MTSKTRIAIAALVKPFHSAALFDLTLTLALYNAYGIRICMIPSSSPEKHFGKVGLAVVISLVSVTDKAKRDKADLWPDDVTCELKNIFKHPFKSIR